MKILNVISLMDPVNGGGIKERIYHLSKHLIQRGHQCTILATSRGWNQEFIDTISGLEGVNIPCLSERYMIPKGAGKWLDENIHRFDVVHLAGNWSPINVFAYYSARKNNIPYVFSGMGLLDIIERSILFKHIYSLVWTRPMLRNANAVIAISPREYRNCVRLGVKEENISFIPNGITPDGLDVKDDDSFRSYYGLDNRKIILYIARLSHEKGVDLLVEAFALIASEFSDHQLVIFGNDHGGFKAYVEKRIDILNIRDKVKIFPPVFGVRKSWAYHAAELFVIPSRYDTMTIVALEVAVCACPMLITDQADFPAIGESGGALIVKSDAQAVAVGLRRLLVDPHVLNQMGARASKFVLENYHWNIVSQSFIELFYRVSNAGKAAT
jgi:glycosyltransferase involved in cell wall biosynthesis